MNGKICDGKIQIGEAKQPIPRGGSSMYINVYYIYVCDIHMYLYISIFIYKHIAKIYKNIYT